MSTLLLVRHGQASFGQQNYDLLSELGSRQALWLGEYLRETGSAPQLILRGSLVRHQQTADMIATGLQQDIETIELPGWNEFDFKAIAYAYLTQHPEQAPRSQDARAFFALLKQALRAWSEGRLEQETPETWPAFQQRIAQVLAESCSYTELNRVLVVSSGGAISMALGTLLGLSAEAVIDLNLQTRNTGVSEVFYNAQRRYLSSFNTLPHMTQRERLGDITSA